GYGIPGIRVDGNDFLAVYAVTQWAAERARTGAGPTLIELVTYRVAPHSTSDDPSRYRPKDDSERWPLGDPIERLKSHLKAIGEWSDEREKMLLKQCDEQVAEAWREAIKYGTLTDGPQLDAATLFDDVFKDMTPSLVKQRQLLAAARAEQKNAQKNKAEKKDK
ncbi:MAG: thiamine pyrophosphate-dependent enzyme, partial [Steroidobacteraceae bacterium]